MLGGFKLKTIRKIITTFLCVSLLFSNAIAFAHSGRTDSSGGHHDYKNRSGLGSYHYHHGMGPHLHSNGVCPYSSTSRSTAKSSTSTNKTSKYYRSSTVKKVQTKLNKLGYKCGKADGSYGIKTKKAIKKFQRKKGIAVNGKINKSLLRKLKIKI